MNNRRVAAIMMFPLLILVLIACESANPLRSGETSVYSAITATPWVGENQEAAYAAAQDTLIAGQDTLIELSNQATAVSLDIDQAANAAAQTTLENNQRRLMELSIQSTEVSLNMARAAATQQFIAQQTQMVWDATASAQSLAATATYAAYLFIVTQTGQAQAILDLQVTHVAEANATWVAYSLTATPWAAMQADIARARKESQQRAWWGQFVIAPVKVILITVIVLLLILGGVMAYQQLMPLLELRLSTIWRDSSHPLLLVDGMIVDAAPAQPQLTQQELRLLEHPELAMDEVPHVEIVGASEPSITNWISEAEQKLHSEGWVQA